MNYGHNSDCMYGLPTIARCFETAIDQALCIFALFSYSQCPRFNKSAWAVVAHTYVIYG